MALNLETLEQLIVAIRDERRVAGNTASKVGGTMLEMLRYITDGPFLRKDRVDEDKYLLKLLAGAVIGESAISLLPDGSISCGSIRVNGSAIFDELVFNHQNILEGDTYFTDRAIVEAVEQVGTNVYLLTLRKEYDDESITFHVNDVCRQVVNRLDTARSYFTSWYRVEEVDNYHSQIRVTLYDNSQVPGGENFAPQASGRMVRWGNSVDKDRQQTFFISAQDGRFLFLQGVTKPILDDTNYSAFLGLPPELECLKDLPLNKRQPYIYARGIIVQDLIRIDYKGNPVYQARERGQWSSSEEYIRGYDDVENGYYEDRVWWGGCLWACSVDKATVGREPRFNNTEWTCLIGGGNMSLEIISTAGEYFRANTSWTTTLVAQLWNAEMQIEEEELGSASIWWTRESDDFQGDNAWNIEHSRGKCGMSVEISSLRDIPSMWFPGSKVSFTVNVELPGGEDAKSSFGIQY